MKTLRLSTLARALVGLEIVVAVALMLRLLPVEAWLQRGRGALAGLGPFGPVLYSGLYALGVVVFAPGSLLTMGSGLAFGPAWGLASASAGSTAGAAAAFLIARYVARSRVEAWVENDPRLVAIDRAIGERGWKIVALTRLSPIFPFNALNYGYGVTRVGFLEYVLASWVAMLPGTFLYVYIGSLGRVGVETLTGSRMDAFGVVLNVLGLAATAAVTYLVTLMARRALRAAEAGDVAG